jgi:tight adherence protein B
MLLPVLVVTIGLLSPLLLLALVFSGPSAGKRVAQRLERIREQHGSPAVALARAQLRLAVIDQTRFDVLLHKLVPKPAELREKLERSGKDWTLTGYVAASLGIVAVVAALLIFKGFGVFIGGGIGIVLGLFLPKFVVDSVIKRRVNKFNTRFPDAIDLLVRGLRSGLPISETLIVVGKEVPGPVGDEFRAISDRIRIGRTMDQALQETADRLGTAEFQFFVITIAIQRETGGNLAETLSNLADVLRKRAQMKLKVKALSSESKASAYIVGALPFIVFTLIYFVSPNYMSQFFVDQRLKIAGFGGLIWMSIGAFIMAKMVNFEI